MTRKKGKVSPWQKFASDMLGDIFLAAEVFYYTNAELSEKSGLSLPTVYRMRWLATTTWDRNHEPRLSTIWRLARAVGMDMKLFEREARKAVTRRAG